MRSTVPARSALILTIGIAVGLLGAWTVSVARERSLIDAAVLMVPLTVLFMFLSLPIENACRSAELSASGLHRLILTHVPGALLTASIWTLIAIGLGKIHTALAGVVWSSGTYRLIFVEGLVLYLLAAGGHYLAIEIKRTAGAQQRAVEARATANEAELRALRMQINPHFLFNSLNSISSLCGSDPIAARNMTNKLASFFRSSLSLAGVDLVPLDRELETIQQYLEIERVRFGDRLEVTVDCTKDLGGIEVPPLILQPLVENAVKHGAATIVGAASISISCRKTEDGRGSIVVTNDTDRDRPPGKGTDTGLKNVRSRLSAVYGDKALLETKDQGDRFTATVVIPATS